MRLTPEEKQEVLDTVAEMIASTIHGASGVDVHQVLANSQAVPQNWREIVQQKVDARQSFSTGGRSNDASSAEHEAPQPLPVLPPLQTSKWDCPKCGARQEVVDARKSLRRSCTSPAVRILSDTVTSLCPACAKAV
ncbi:hypothetical protein DQ04_02541100 [Trypanosoma grayi]|uniref:hypothetical protein n=1 Tax=Trypanosoma grayi TaxID=71804 RepID=UPI0004F4B7D8|nr:hypothetical protein DQ04_02541100 [Trypanosoma grayi]KEG11521.1 hypothetical protein DQ04_02541100 [Trypanosoma grayi]